MSSYRTFDGPTFERWAGGTRVRMIVGFAAGGPTDIPARYIADKLGDLIGQRVVVENKPAAAGMLATREALAQPRDGYTLLLCTHFESINVAVYKNPQYRLAELAPISLIAKYYYGIGLSNVVPATDIASFASYAKARPGEISYGTLGPGSAQEIFARQLERRHFRRAERDREIARQRAGNAEARQVIDQVLDPHPLGELHRDHVARIRQRRAQ